MKIKNKKNIVLLIFVVVLIWGMIFINIVSIVNSNHRSTDETKTVKNYIGLLKNKTNPPKQNENITYALIERDPFLIPIAPPTSLKKRPKIIQQKDIKPKLKQINYKVRGTIINHVEKLLIMEDITNNRIIFLREGEQYKGIKIDSILIEHVILTDGPNRKDILFPR